MSSATSGMARAVPVVAAGILLSRILGFARNVVLANRLGDTTVADAYEAAFIVPDFLNYLLAGGLLSITFIPILSHYLARGDHDGARLAFNAVFRPVAVLIIVLTGVGMAGAGVMVDLLFGSGGQLDEAELAEITRLTRMVLPTQIFFVTGGLLMSVQYARGRFLVPTLAPIIYNASIILGGLVGTWSGEASATGFVVGAVAGALIGNFGLQWWGVRRLGMSITFGRVDFRHPAFADYLRLAFPLMVGQSIVVLDESMGKVVAAAASEGSIFALNLARRVNMVPVGVIAQAAAVAAYPLLARQVAEGRTGDMLVSMGRALRMVVFASGCGGGRESSRVSQPAVRMAFQHGQFSPEGTVLTAAALIGYSLSIPAWGVHQVYGRGVLCPSPDVAAGGRRNRLDGGCHSDVRGRLPDRRSAGGGRCQFRGDNRSRPHPRTAVAPPAHIRGYGGFGRHLVPGDPGDRGGGGSRLAGGGLDYGRGLARLRDGRRGDRGRPGCGWGRVSSDGPDRRLSRGALDRPAPVPSVRDEFRGDEGFAHGKHPPVGETPRWWTRHPPFLRQRMLDHRRDGGRLVGPGAAGDPEAHGVVSLVPVLAGLVPIPGFHNVYSTSSTRVWFPPLGCTKAIRVPRPPDLGCSSTNRAPSALRWARATSMFTTA